MPTYVYNGKKVVVPEGTTMEDVQAYFEGQEPKGGQSQYAGPYDPSNRTPTGEPLPGDPRNAFQRKADLLITPDPRREEWQSRPRTLADTLARGVAENVIPIVSHPVSTVGGVMKQAGQAIAHPEVTPSGAPGAGILAAFFRPQVEQAVQEFQEDPTKAAAHLAGQGAGMWATGEVGGAAAKGAKNLAGTMRKGVRPVAQKLTGLGERAVREDVASTARNAGEEAKATEEANRAALKKYESDVQSAEKKNLRAHMEHQVAKTEAEQTNAAARAIPDARAGLEKHIADQSKDLRAEIETAREKALEEGNKNYSTINEKLNHVEADLGNVNAGLEAAANKIKGSQIRGAEANPRILDDIQTRIKKGDTFTYEDLQGYYSELNMELCTGTLPGDVYAAYDTIHESIGNDMQRIADNQGMGAELTEARNYWRRMKQAFGKEYKPTDAATKTMERASPEWARAEDEAKQLNLLGSFNHMIPDLVKGIRSARERLSALPSESVRPTAKIPEYPEGVMAEPPKTKTVEVPEVNTRALREKLLDKWVKGEEGIGRYQVARLMSGGIGAVIGALMDRGLGAGIGGTLGATLGPTAIAKLVESPVVREWLTRPPAGELEALQKLPYADRIRITDGLKKVAQEAQKKGVKVNPAWTAAGYAAPVASQQKKLRDLYPEKPTESEH